MSTMSYSPIEQCNDQNLVAVELLRQGLSLQAQDVFKGALARVRDACANNNQSSLTPTKRRLASIEIMNHTPSVETNESLFLLFNKAFVMLPAEEKGDESVATPSCFYKGSSAPQEAQHAPDELQDTLVSILLMYNMALTMHMRALHQPRHSTPSASLFNKLHHQDPGAARNPLRERQGQLHRARQVYQRVFWLLGQYGPALSPLLPGIEIILLACCNNMGHIASVLWQVPEMQTAQEQLKTLVTAASGTMALSMIAEDLKFFAFTVVLWESMVHFNRTSLPLAPAA